MNFLYTTDWKMPKVVELPKSRYRIIERPRMDTKVIVTIVIIVTVSIAWAILV